MYENGKPFFKKWNIVVLRKRIIRNFKTSMRVFMEFVKYSFKESKVKAYTNGGVYQI